MIGRKRIFRAPETVEVLKAQHQRPVAVAADVKILVVYVYAKDPPADDARGDDAQKDDEYDLLF
jgi:hypothetical protein